MNDSGYWEKVLERREKVAVLTREGKSAAEISVILGITARSVTRQRKALGISKPAAVPLSEDALRRARELAADGCSRMEVARTIGCSPTTIERHFHDFDWPPVELWRSLAQHRRWAEYRMKAWSA
jgi:DNA-binding CsgD family transcriptional regulator